MIYQIPVFVNGARGTSLFFFVFFNPIKLTDPTGMWIDNEDGTSTAEKGDTLWSLAEKKFGDGSKWQELGYTGDPSKLQVGEKVGREKEAQKNKELPLHTTQARVEPKTQPNDKTIWRQIGSGALDVLGGALGIAGAFALDKKAKSPAIKDYTAPLFVEGLTSFCYGIAEISAGFNGQKMPSLEKVIAAKISKGMVFRDSGI